MKTLRYYILLFALICTQAIIAQVNFEVAVSRDSVPLNHTVRVLFTINQDGDNFTPPIFNNFTIVEGPNQSVSTSWMNGERIYKKTYFYVVKPKIEGILTIEPTSIEINKRIYRTEPINITVSNDIVPEIYLKDTDLNNIRYTLKARNPTVYENDFAIIDHYILTTIPINGFLTEKHPVFKHYFDISNSLSDTTFYKKTTINRTEKYVAKLYSSIYCMLTIGKQEKKAEDISLKIPLYKKRLSNLPTILDETIEKDYTSNNLTIKVKPLPKKDKPKNFSKAVGTFDFKVVPSALKVKSGEKLTIKLEVTGIGNIPIIELPPLTLSNIKTTISDPETDDKIEVNKTGVIGSIFSSYTLTPQQVGTFTINPIEFTYFDPQKKKYITIHTESITITVTD
ncbi:BatD family protein [Myroides odoratimimus]|uniref:BatD family protein n=1 Tax=Myroides odoratimimus TaxID=76832 RepID=UPI002574C54B|nr:BatD family protein [Myroides odoratimimus]MDM1397051.1 BatD family protein [Myroides odoratimimus]